MIDQMANPTSLTVQPPGADRKTLRDWETIKTAADYIGCTPLTIRRMISRGDIKAYRFGERLIRIKRQDLLAAMRPVTDAADLH